MKLKILKDKEGREHVNCPKGEVKYIPDCRKDCKYFKGYKTKDDSTWQRQLLCKYK